MSTNHQIAKLIFEINFLSQYDALEKQGLLSSLIRNEITNALEDVLNSFDTKDSTIRIDYLEIELQDVDLFTSSSETISIIKEQFQEQISKIIRKGDITEHTYHTNVNAKHENEDNVQSIDFLTRKLELLIFMLKNGHLPWWASSAEPIQIKHLLDEIIKEKPDLFFSKIINELIYRNVRQRVIRQLSIKQLNLLIKTLLPDSILQPRFFKSLSQLNINFQESIYNQVIESGIKMTEYQSPQLFFAEVIKSLLLKSIKVEQFIHPQDYSEKSQWKESLETVWGKQLVITQIDNQINKENLSKVKKDKSIELDKSSEIINNELIIKNAGLVITQLYLLPFFEKLGLLVKNKFASDDHQHRAVYILHFLAGGLPNETEEHELLIEKILCGLSPNDALMPFTEITETVKEECESLLQSIIENWKILKNTSTNNLRNTFIKREGVLKRVDDGWEIHVERGTFDMLLDKLPWTISLLRVTWSGELVYVEW